MAERCVVCSRKGVDEVMGVAHCDEHEAYVRETVYDVVGLIDWKPLKRALRAGYGSIQYEVVVRS